MLVWRPPQAPEKAVLPSAPGKGFVAGSVHDNFEESLHENINQIVRTLEQHVDDSTVYGILADHGHHDTDPEKFMDLADSGEVLDPLLRLGTIIQANSKLRVGKQYADRDLEYFEDTQAKIESALQTLPILGDVLGSGRKDPNVIFVPHYSIANIYVAGNTTSSESYDWTRPPSAEDLEPIVNGIYDWYMSGELTPLRPVSDILVRVPSEINPNSFQESRYMFVPRDYFSNKSDCGPSGTERCGLARQLVELGDYFDMHAGIGEDPAFPWTFNHPVDRINNWISANTGDIVLLGNAREGYQFDKKGARGQHGSLTYADSLVPIAFGYPGSTGDADKDTTLKAIVEFLSELPTEETGDEEDEDPAIQAIAEAEAILRFFGIEN